MSSARMTRSSIVAALVVTVLLAILIESRDEPGPVERSTDALSPGPAPTRAPGEVAAVPTARPVSPSPAPSPVPSIPLDGTPDAAAPGVR